MTNLTLFNAPFYCYVENKEMIFRIGIPLLYFYARPFSTVCVEAICDLLHHFFRHQHANPGADVFLFSRESSSSRVSFVCCESVVSQTLSCPV